jgi:hypothetical protein
VAGCILLALSPHTASGQESSEPSLRLSGRIHRMVMQVRDGSETNGFFTDSDQGPTMLRADARREAASGWWVAGTVELGIQSNRPFRVSQDVSDPGTELTVRDAELVLGHPRFGTASFGRGFASAWVLPSLDLSGTTPGASLAVGMLAPGMKFVDAATNELSDVRVNDHFADAERLLLSDRFRYDSPALAGGMTLSGSIAADARWDASLRYFPDPEEWSVRAAATYQHEPYRDVEHKVDLGVAVRHEDSGLSLIPAVGRSWALDGRDVHGLFLKVGWLADLVSVGTTAFSVDGVSIRNAAVSGERSESFGAFVQQRLSEMDLLIYSGFRRYEVERPDIGLRPLNVLATGASFSF